MELTKLAHFILLALMLSAGQILFKFAALSLRGPIGFDLKLILSLLFNPFMLAALVIYGTATAFWVVLLSSTELSRGYMIFALTLVIVPLAGVFLFNEPFSIRQAAGLVVILAGLWLALV